MQRTKYNRRKRHRENAKLRNSKSVRPHRHIGGRTGMIWKKQTHSQKYEPMKVVIPNKPTATPFGVSEPKPSGFVNALTGKPVMLDDPEQNEQCPQCGSHSVISDQPSISRCLKCGWNDD